jgi:hypothetical protein
MKRPKIKIIDTPGLDDPGLPADIWVEKVDRGVEGDRHIDMAVLVLKATDFKMTTE